VASWNVLLHRKTDAPKDPSRLHLPRYDVDRVRPNHDASPGGFLRSRVGRIVLARLIENLKLDDEARFVLLGSLAREHVEEAREVCLL
jgi:hypothetical protein